ncbi:CaiB/BaiF CoA transferase family protein [Chloroflexota bacterium]
MEFNGLLTPYRVLDLTEDPTATCAKVLGDLGADVLKIERPGGDPCRNTGPFYHDNTSPEQSLSWFAWNNSKRSITLNIETSDGQEIFKRLIESADFIIESFRPGYLSSLGLDYATLSKINKHLIMTSITPFGQTGPYSLFKSSDLINMALGGMMTLIGYPDRAPLRFSVEQSYIQAGTQAAAAASMALYYRHLEERGQHIDVSMQESVVATTWTAQYYWGVTQTMTKRGGLGHKRGRVNTRMVFPCKDGFIIWGIIVAQQGAKTRALIELMEEEGMAGELANVEWEKRGLNEVLPEEMDHWNDMIASFFMTHTKDELYEEAQKRGILLMPVCNFEDIASNEQLEYRSFWNPVYHPELDDTLIYPGIPFKSSEGDMKIKVRPPMMGEHNDDIYRGELGLSSEYLQNLRSKNVI